MITPSRLSQRWVCLAVAAAASMSLPFARAQLTKGDFEFTDGKFSPWVLTGSWGNGQLLESGGSDIPSGGAVPSLRLRDTTPLNGVAGGAALVSQDIHIDPSKTYTFSVWVKVAPGSNPVTIRLKQLEATGEDFLTIRKSGNIEDTTAAVVTAFTVDNTSWTKITQTFGEGGIAWWSDTGASPAARYAGGLRIELFASTQTGAPANAATTGEVWYDDVWLTESGGTTNLVANGGFGSAGGLSLSGWTNEDIEFYRTEIGLTADAHAGSYAVQLYDNAGADFACLHQEVAVDPSAFTGLHNFSFWAKGTGYAKVRQLDRNRRQIGVTDTTIAINTPSYTQTSKTLSNTGGGGDIQLASSTRFLLVYFYAGAEPANANMGTLLVDDVVVNTPAATVTPDTPTTPPLVVNNVRRFFYDSFSGGALYSAWTVNSGTIDVVTSHVNSPPYSMRLNNGDSVQRALNLSRSNDDVVVSYSRRLQSLQSGDQLKVEWLDQAGTPHNLETVSGSSGWIAKTFTLSGANVSGFRLRFAVTAGATDRRAYVDDVKVTGTASSVSDYTLAPPILGFEPPLWFSDYLLHTHSRFGLADLNAYEAANPGSNFPQWIVQNLASKDLANNRYIGANVATSYTRSGQGGLWYDPIPSEQPEAIIDPAVPLFNGLPRNIAEEMADAALANKMRFIAYHWTHSDFQALYAHPDWAQRDYLGHLIDDNRGYYMSFGSEYADYLKKILLSETSYGLDGYYFDSFDFSARAGDYNPGLISRYQQEYPGDSLPTSSKTTDPKVVKLQAIGEKFTEEFLYNYTAALRAIDPQFTVLAAGPDGFLFRPYRIGRADIATSTDTPKTESIISGRATKGETPVGTDKALARPRQDVETALTAATFRDAGRKRAHAWNERRELDADVDSDATHPDYDRNTYLRAIVGLGATFGWHVNLHNLIPKPANPVTGELDFEDAPPPNYSDANYYGQLLDPHLRGASYLTWAAVYVPDDVRLRKRLGQGNKENNAYAKFDADPDHRNPQALFGEYAWQDTIVGELQSNGHYGSNGAEPGNYAWAIWGAVQTLMEQRVPWGIVTDRQVANYQDNASSPFRNLLDQIKVIIVPNWRLLTPTEQANLNAWAAQAGAGRQLVTMFKKPGGVETYLDDTNLLWYEPTKRHAVGSTEGLFDNLWAKITAVAGQPPLQVVAQTGGDIRNTRASFMRTHNGTLVVSLLNDIDWVDLRASQWILEAAPIPQSQRPAPFAAKLLIRGTGYTATSAQLAPRPSATNLTITTTNAGTSNQLQEIPIGSASNPSDPNNIRLHALVVLKDTP